jgi:hypothetical protein
MLLQVRLQLLHVFDFVLLLLQFGLRLLELAVLVPQSVDLCLQLVWLLLLNHPDVAGRDLFDFGQTAVTESVA